MSNLLGKNVVLTEPVFSAHDRFEAGIVGRVTPQEYDCSSAIPVGGILMKRARPIAQQARVLNRIVGKGGGFMYVGDAKTAFWHFAREIVKAGYIIKRRKHK